MKVNFDKVKWFLENKIKDYDEQLQKLNNHPSFLTP